MRPATVHKLAATCGLGALLLVILALNGNLADHPTADDLLSKALWDEFLTLTDGSAEAAEASFSAALAGSANKAPVYAWMGELKAGPQQLGQVIKHGAASGDGDPLDQLVQAMAESFEAGNAHALACFQAAVQCDPQFLPAWLRLAVRGDETVREQATTALLRLDPQNAMGHYLRAALRAATGDLVAALETVEQGNAQPYCRIYPLPFPAQNRLRYPDEEPFRKSGVAGMPIPPTSLAFLIEADRGRWNWADPMTRTMRELQRALTDESARKAADDEREEAVRILFAVQGLGLHQLCNETRDSLCTVGGLLPANLATKRLIELSGWGTPVSAVMRTLADKLEVFRQAFLEMNEAPEEAEQAQIYRGTLDFWQRYRERLQAALEKSGLLERDQQH